MIQESQTISKTFFKLFFLGIYLKISFIIVLNIPPLPPPIFTVTLSLQTKSAPQNVILRFENLIGHILILTQWNLFCIWKLFFSTNKTYLFKHVSKTLIIPLNVDWLIPLSYQMWLFSLLISNVPFSSFQRPNLRIFTSLVFRQPIVSSYLPISIRWKKINTAIH